MKAIFCRRLLVLFILAQLLLAAGKSEPINYESLDLSITVAGLRSGNHDASGLNEYYFATTLYGLPILKEDIKKPFEERQKTERKQGEFGQISIKNLKHWQVDKKPNPAHTLPVAGDTIREIVAETMRGFKVPEDRVAILVRVEMFERNRKLILFGEDLKVGETQFNIIPESLPHAPVVQNHELAITDALGTKVDLAVRFKVLEPSKKP